MHLNIFLDWPWQLCRYAVEKTKRVRTAHGRRTWRCCDEELKPHISSEIHLIEHGLRRTKEGDIVPLGTATKAEPPASIHKMEADLRIRPG